MTAAKSRAGTRWIVRALVAATVTIGLCGPSHAEAPKKPRARGGGDYLPVVVVRPFGYDGPKDQSWTAVACREYVIWKLQRTGKVDCPDSFLADELLVRLAGKGDNRREVTLAMLHAAVGATRVIEGSCAGGTVDFEAAITVAGPDRDPVKAGPIAGASLLDWCAAVARQTIEAMELGRRTADNDNRPTMSPSAWEFYAQARQALSARQVRQAHDLALDALTRDEKFRLAHRLRARTLTGIGRWDLAGKATRQYIRLASNARDRVDILAAVHNMALVCVRRDMPEMARELFEEALDSAETLETRSNVFAEMAELGRFFLVAHGQAKTRAAVDDDLATAAENDDPEEVRKQQAEAKKLRKLADQHLRSAAERFSQALEFARATGNMMAVQEAHNQIGLLNDVRENYREAASAHRRALDVAVRIDDRYGQAVALHQLGQIAQKQKRPDEALGYYQRSLQAAESHGTRDQALATFSNMATVHKQQSQFGKALAAQEKGILLCAESGSSATALDKGASYANLGSIYEAMRQYAEAKANYEKAIEEFLKIGHPRVVTLRDKVDEMKRLTAAATK